MGVADGMDGVVLVFLDGRRCERWCHGPPRYFPAPQEELGGDLCWGVQMQDGRTFRYLVARLGGLAAGERQVMVG